MSKHKCNFVLFGIGACGYGLLEVVWRGYTHWSMLSAGGICFVMFGSVSEWLKSAKPIIKGLVGSGIITGVELVFGLIFNIILKKNVWDYSRLPLNIGGQICIIYSFLWMILSIFIIPVAGIVNRRLQNRK